MNTMSGQDAVPEKVSVIIVGAGPTGLTAANLLGLAGIETLVVERNKDVCDFTRAIAIDDEGLRVLQATGLMDKVLAHMRSAIKAHYVSQGRFLARIEPNERRNGHPLISAFHQPTLEGILLQGTTRFACVNVLFQHTLIGLEQDEAGVYGYITTPDSSSVQVKCDYLLACDGGKSTIRHALNIGMERPYGGRRGRTQAYGQRWLVVDCISDSEPSDTIIFFCNPGRPAVSVPGPGQQRRWEFMLLAGEREEDLLEDETIHTLIWKARRSMPRWHYTRESQSVATFQIIRKTIYTFHALCATNFVKGRVFLLGDAAHLMPPFGGQGMNSGLRDAHNLCWKLQLVIQGRAKPRLLASYQVERQPHVTQMILFSWLLGKMIMPTQRLIAFLRDIVLRNVDKIAHEAIKEMRVKPQPRYKHGFLIDQKETVSRLVGRLLPQPEVLYEGKRVLLDDVLGNGFALLSLRADTQTAFQGLSSEVWSRLGVRLVTVLPAETENKQAVGISIVDVEQQLSAFVGNRHDLYVLVRPDRYVMGVFSHKQADMFGRALESKL